MLDGWWLALPTIGAALIGLALTRRLWRRRTVPGVPPLLAVAVLVAAWCAAYSAVLLVPSFAIKEYLFQVQYVAVCTVPPLWLALVLELVAPARWWHSRPWFVVLLGVPATIGVVLALTNHLHHWVWRAAWPVRLGPLATVAIERGPAFWPIIAFAYACVTFGAVVLAAMMAFGSPSLRRPATYVLIGSIAPVGLNSLFLARLTPLEAYDPTAVAAMIAVALWTRGLLSARLASLVPLVRDRLFSAMSDAVIVLDGNDLVVDANASARRLLWSTSVPLGARVATALPADAWRLISVAAPRPVQVRLPVDGEVRPFEARVEVVPGSDGAVLGRILLLRDATDAERATETRLRLSRMEASAALVTGTAQRVEDLLRAIRGHATAAAAALATPGAATLLPSDGSRAVAERLAGIAETASVGDALVAQMLRLSSDTRLEPQPVELGALVARVVRAASEQFPAGIELRCAVDRPVLEILGDPRALEELLAALLRNSREALANGGTVEVAVDRIRHELRAPIAHGGRPTPRDFVRLRVRDDGAGMSEDTAAHMFEPFFSTKGRGRGLELAVGYGTVIGHRGEITVESAPGRGTTVTVCLPAITPRGRIRDLRLRRAIPADAPDSGAASQPAA